jgi:hypothetical protein
MMQVRSGIGPIDVPLITMSILTHTAADAGAEAVAANTPLKPATNASVAMSFFTLCPPSDGIALP